MEPATDWYRSTAASVPYSAYVRLPDSPSRGYAVGMPISQNDWTVELVNALPDDGNRYEVIDGELFVTPAPAMVHQRAAAELYRMLAPYAKSLSLDIMMAPAAVTFSKRREVQPDLLVIPRKADGTLATRFADVGVLLLAVEILSPHTKRVDRVVKRALYQEEGVRDYWMVDTNARCIERWAPENREAERFTETISWQPVVAREPLLLDISAYFDAVFS